MSGLSYICDEYGSNSEDSDTDKGQEFDRPKLPAPNLSKVVVVASHTHTDNPELHGGRSRLFPHVRGNWASFVYVNYDQIDAVCNLIDKLEEVVVTKSESCHRCDDFHISLSRTFVLKYHFISAFSSSLHKCLANTESFHLGFGAVKIYCNEDCSRTFISLEVDPFAQKHLQEISNKVDQVLTEFQLPPFYENPSFHMSILWVNGDKKFELESILDELNEILSQEVEKSLHAVLVETINCKSGNKYFQYKLR
ncbi:U6 snRNA phosphodiesterase 1 [Helicoverpa zea]|uniref:U6 snRNA phosphodiesterase 1 n=1 Tax=Helicoverpa zea TaxID=7113 RepID=UPI001F58E2FA|nr:U6 snRNA phosphodiesterase 1 [Helicoverpa zea]